MNNKEELIKMFDEKINTLGYNAERYIEHNERLKKIFFETIIPEVIKDILKEKTDSANIYGEAIDVGAIQHLAKDIYGIEL